MASNEQMDRFLRGESKPTREPQQSSPRKRGKRPPAKTVEKEIADAFWAGVKDGFIYMLKKLDPDGPCCMECGTKGTHQTLDLDHIRPKSLGGANRAHNAQLLCRVHHRQKHGEPRFGESVAVESGGTE